MQVRLYRPSQLTQRQIESWRELMHVHAWRRHPHLTPEWAQIIERVGRPVEVAEFQTPESTGWFAYERLSRNRAIPLSGPFSDCQAIHTPAHLSLDIRHLLVACRLTSFRFDHVPVGESWTESAQWEADRAFEVSLLGGYSQYWEQLQRSHSEWCRQLERKRRKLSREVGAVRFELHQDSSSAMNALIEWKQRQLVSGGMKNVFRFPWSKSLLNQTIREQSTDFSGWLSTLYAGQQLVAVHLGQRSGQVLNAWIPAHHPGFSAYSPGALLHLELLRRSAEEGITQVDLGRGENPLKIRLANSISMMAIGMVHRNRWRQWCSRRWFQIRSRLIRASKSQKWVRLCRNHTQNTGKRRNPDKLNRN
ncbi:MAG TPA: GNAT family N-acetyltransferase [Pirellulaceae bacterium]|nr:GNAT family N-acetyltransferase [Pirellulaceae bacterium]